MSRISCNVNKDLLPLYVDDVCSEESKDLVEEHLSECGECQNYYEALKEGLLEAEVKGDKENILSEEKMRQVAASIIKDIKKQISRRQIQTVCVAVAIALIFIFVLEGLNGAYMGSELQRVPLFDTRLKVSDMHVTELYQLQNGYLYISVETDKKFSIVSSGNLNDNFDQNEGVTDKYTGEIALRRELWGGSIQMKKCSFIYPLSGVVENREGELVECEDSAIYLEGKGDQREKVWEKGEAVEKAPPEIEGMAKKEIEAEAARRHAWNEDGGGEKRTDPYVIMDNENGF